MTTTPSPKSDVILDVRGLTKLFRAGGGFWGGEKKFVHAVDDVNFTLHRGEILALVGESGSGKSTIARVLSGLYPATAGTAMFHGQDVLKLHGRRQLLQLSRPRADGVPGSLRFAESRQDRRLPH